MVFDFLQVLTEFLQLCGFSIVAQRYVSFERGLVTKQFILVSFVRPDSHIDWRVEVHPGDITVVIVVGSKCRRALVQEIFQRPIGSERRRLA